MPYAQTDNAQAENSLDLLVFEIDVSRFGLDLATVQEVVRAVMISPLPGAPPVIEGIIDARGHIVPVYDLRTRFGMPPRPLHADDRFLLAWANARLVAVHCERVEWLASVPRAALERSDAASLGDRRIAGAVSLEDGIILITDLAAFLDDAETVALDAALAAVPRPAS